MCAVNRTAGDVSNPVIGPARLPDEAMIVGVGPAAAATLTKLSRLLRREAMSRELDRRDFTANKVTPARETELQASAASVSNALPGDQRIEIERFDPTTGNAAAVRIVPPPTDQGNYAERALEYIQRVSPALGLTATQAPEFVVDPHVQQTSSGATAVHLQQRYKGIPIFQAAQTVRFAPDDTLTESVGSSVTVPGDIDADPQIRVDEAVQRAAEHVAVPDRDEQQETDQFGQPLNPPTVDLAGFTPTVIATFAESPQQHTVLEPGPFGDELKASLIWFPLSDTLRLAWEVINTMPGYAGQYRTIVDAKTGEILYCKQLVQTVSGRGNVYHVDGAGARQFTDFPRTLGDYGLPIPGDLPTGFPDSWVEADRTVGNSVNAHVGDAGASVQGTLQDGRLTFNPASAVDPDQMVVNIFYYNDYMHDLFYLLGFRERDGNFQRDNFGRGGLASDRVDARAHPNPVRGTANMLTPVDGRSPVMNMGLVERTNRHTAFDSSVVFHEYMHGVTNRLVGGPLNVQALDAPQSGGMGEGWGDFLACTINNTTVVGAWVVDRPGGIRGFPYDSNFPDHFGNLGTGRYREVHNNGEIWCATLMEMNRNIGKVLGLQLVVDALKLSPANPSFLDMRDAILSALENKQTAGQVTTNQFRSARRGIWTAFAKFGMGPGAQSNGAQLTGIVADFNLPDDLVSAGISTGEPLNVAWFECDVRRAGPADDGKIYIWLRDREGAFDHWFYAHEQYEKEMLDTALTAITADLPVTAALASTNENTRIDRLYVVKS